MSAEVRAAKAAMRQRVRATLPTLAPAQRALEEELVTAAVQQTPEWQAARTVLLYRSLAPELSTVGLVNAAWRTGKRTVFPRQTAAGLSLHAVGSWADFVPGKHGVLEPRAGPLVAPSDVDLAIIPGLAFSPRGARLGRGGGDFDRLLGQLRLAWGVAFDVQVMPEIPMEKHDLFVQRVVHAAAVV